MHRKGLPSRFPLCSKVCSMTCSDYVRSSRGCSVVGGGWKGRHRNSVILVSFVVAAEMPAQNEQLIIFDMKMNPILSAVKTRDLAICTEGGVDFRHGFTTA